MKTESPGRVGNSFTFLRLVLALAVVYGHTYALGGFGDEPLTRFTAGATTGRELAVQGFFIISGFLLTNSLLRSPSLGRFSIRRIFRILPAYWVALLVTSLAVAPALFATLFPGKLTYGESLTIGDYNALGYLQRNGLFWQGQKWILPLFLRNHVPGVVNGSLWSLFYEVFAYLLLGIGSWLGALRRRSPALFVFALLYVPSFVQAFTPVPSLPKGPISFEMFNMALHPAGPCVFLAFSAGVAARLLSGGSPVWNTRWFILIGLALAISCPLGAIRLIWPLTLPYLIIALAEVLPFGKLDRIGDFSYGIYIYSFLIQQCLVAFGWQNHGFVTFLALSVGLSVAAGAGSWFLVEKTAIAIGQRIVRRFSSSSVSGLNPAPQGAPDLQRTELLAGHP